MSREIPKFEYTRAKDWVPHCAPDEQVCFATAWWMRDFITDEQHEEYLYAQKRLSYMEGLADSEDNTRA